MRKSIDGSSSFVQHSCQLDENMNLTATEAETMSKWFGIEFPIAEVVNIIGYPGKVGVMKIQTTGSEGKQILLGIKFCPACGQDLNAYS